jgi:hypothetical protein
MKSLIVIGAIVLGFVAGAVPAAAGANPPAVDARAAFDQLKSLSGEWERKAPDGGRSHLTYEVVSAGSAVVEHFVDDAMGADNAMVTVYYVDGGRLLLTHYCMAHNQPRMQAESYNPATGELRFGFLDATGLASPDAGHMHSASFRFVDAKHFTSEWHFMQGGKTTATENFEYTRVR